MSHLFWSGGLLWAGNACLLAGRKCEPNLNCLFYHLLSIGAYMLMFRLLWYPA